MLFVLICTDKPGALELRKANRDAHLEFIKGLGDTIKLGGPIITEDGEGMTGSLLVLEADSRQAVEDIAAEDPYAKADLFETVDIRPWKWTVGNPEA